LRNNIKKNYLHRLLNINIPIILLCLVLFFVGFLNLYSIGHAYAYRQLIYFFLSCVVCVIVLSTRTKFFFDYAYIIYAIVLILLLWVELFGRVGMGAKRWLDLHIIQIQPSELMRLALLLALCRYFHFLEKSEKNHFKNFLFPICLIALPVILIIKQPDLDMAIMLILTSAMIFFIVGFPLKFFTGIGILCGVLMPLMYASMHEYQKKRLLIFLDPTLDPKGSGYQLLQSKIALGSAGLWGKGLFKGTQSHLSFLPEKQTDFIFASFAEEFGFIPCVIVLVLFLIIILYGFYVADHCKKTFDRLLAIGLTSTLFLYVAINIGMISGLIPVVGIPLPFFSYGGTALITVFTMIGLLIGIDIEQKFKKRQ
jgi:rod shape determining protein RodA